MITFGSTINRELAALVEQARRSMVMVHSAGPGAGAGVIWRASGIVVTNYHVVARGVGGVTLPSGDPLPATVLMVDERADLAVLRVAASDLEPIAVGSSANLRPGQLVLTLGHPWGQRDYVTAGVIHRFGELRGSRRGTIPVIHTDARLAPGNSGGPLLDASGALIGINAMIVGGDLGVAIPSDEASAFVRGALDRKAALGVQVRPVPLPKPAREQAGRLQEAGLMVIELDEGGAAARAGLLPGDMLVDLAGTPLESPRSLMAALLPHTPGARVALSLLRGGQWQHHEVELGALEAL